MVHRRRADAWAEKELDDIRENIIAYEDEGGGEGDAGYDLHVLRQMYDGPLPDTDTFMQSRGKNIIFFYYNLNTLNMTSQILQKYTHLTSSLDAFQVPTTMGPVCRLKLVE